MTKRGKIFSRYFLIPFYHRNNRKIKNESHLYKKYNVVSKKHFAKIEQYF